MKFCIIILATSLIIWVENVCIGSTGSCLSGSCPLGFSCSDHVCCPLIVSCVNISTSIGPCMRGTCPEDYGCDAALDICCPFVDFSNSTGPCDGRACPLRYLCVGTKCYKKKGPTAIGPCVDKSCSLGLECINEQCVLL